LKTDNLRALDNPLWQQDELYSNLKWSRSNAHDYFSPSLHTSLSFIFELFQHV